jgi:uncharacterized protein YecT (DUF1311 family)
VNAITLPRTLLGAAASALLALGLVAGASASPLKTPVIKENFTRLPCNHKTTLGMEGCAEGQLVAADHQINLQVALLLTSMSTSSQKAAFVKAENLWFTFRGADCMSVSATYQGGSLAPVEFARCEVHDDTERSAALHSQYQLVEQGNSAAPAWP